MTTNNYGVTVEDLEKAASVRLFEKAANAEGINLAALTEDQVENLYAAYSNKEENTMDQDIIDLFEKQASYEGVDLDALSDEELAYVYNNFIEAISDEDVADESGEEHYDEEDDAYEKLAEAEILGRHMARAYMDELEDYDFDKEAATDRAAWNTAKSQMVKELGLSGKALEQAKKDGSLRKLQQERYKQITSGKKERSTKQKAKSAKIKADQRAGGQGRFNKSMKGQEINFSREQKARQAAHDKKLRPERQAIKNQAELVRRQDMTPAQRAAEKQKARMGAAQKRGVDYIKGKGKSLDRGVQEIGTMLGGKADKYSKGKEIARKKGPDGALIGKKTREAGKLLRSGATSRRLRGYGALATGAAALGAGAYGLSKSASWIEDSDDAAAFERMQDFIEFGKEANYDGSFIDDYAVSLLEEDGYDTSSLYEDDGYDGDDVASFMDDEGTTWVALD